MDEQYPSMISKHGMVAADGSMSVATESTSERRTVQSMKSNRDAKLVRRARATVMTVLLVSTVAVATFAYVLLSANEDASFRAKFQIAAQQVILMANQNAVNVFVSIETLSAMYTSSAAMSNATIPFVTIDDFDTMVAGVRNVSKASFIQFKALLHNMEEVDKWNEYSLQNRHWVTDGRHNQVYDDDEIVSNDFPPFVYWSDTNDDPPIPANASGLPFAVNWQISPVAASVSRTNFDINFLPNVKASTAYSGATGKPSLTEPSEKLRKIYKFDVDGPVSSYNHPVFDKGPRFKDRKVKGLISAILAWKHFFDNVLPEDQTQILVVVQSCVTSITFLINKADAQFVGYGDHHDRKYNHMQFTDNFIDTNDENYIIHVYPTSDLEQSFKSYTPVYCSVIIVSIVAFATVVFLLYNCFLTTCQHHTEKQADPPKAIFHDLFPGNMAMRLFERAGTAAAGGRETQTNRGIASRGNCSL